MTFLFPRWDMLVPWSVCIYGGGPPPPKKGVYVYMVAPPQKKGVYVYMVAPPQKKECMYIWWPPPPKKKECMYIWWPPPKKRSVCIYGGPPKKKELYVYMVAPPPPKKRSVCIYGGPPPKKKECMYIWWPPPPKKRSVCIYGGPPPQKKNYVFNKNSSLFGRSLLKGAWRSSVPRCHVWEWGWIAQVGNDEASMEVAERCLSFTRLISYPSKYEKLLRICVWNMRNLCFYLSKVNQDFNFQMGNLFSLRYNQSGFQDGIGQFGFWLAQVFAWFLPLVLCAPQQQGAGY